MKAILFAIYLFFVSALSSGAQQGNPATDIRWPAGATGCSYIPGNNACVAMLPLAGGALTGGLSAPSVCSGTDRINAKGCYGAMGDLRFANRCAITAGSVRLTCTSGPFASKDAHKTAYVRGAGPGGNTLSTSIAAYASSTQVTLGAAAATTVSEATVIYGSDDTAALQKAHDAAVSQQRALYIPAGIYLHHGLNWTNMDTEVEGDAHGSTFLWALAVTNPGRVNTPISGGVGVDISSSQYNEIDRIAFMGGYSGFPDLAPGINVLAARAASSAGPNYFSIHHVFESDYWNTFGPYNLVLYGYEDSDFHNSHFESYGSVNDGTVYMSAANTPGFVSPYVMVQPPTNSMTKINFSGGRTAMACTGKCVVLDDANSGSTYNISFRDFYVAFDAPGSVFLSDTGTTHSYALRHIVMDTVNIEANACRTCQVVNVSSPAWDWRLQNVQFYGPGQSNTPPYVFEGGLFDSLLLIDSSGQATGTPTEVSAPSCAGSILQLGEQQPVTSCTDAMLVSGTSGSQYFTLGRVHFYSGSGVPTGSCSVGDEYNNSAATSASTVKYLCYPANTWKAVMIP